MSEKAGERVFWAIEQKLKYLDLRNCKIVNLPRDIAKLTKLEELYLANNPELSDLSPLSNLKSLISLTISNSKICDLTPLINLHKLEELNISNTQVSDLRPLKWIIEMGLPVKNEEFGYRGIFVKNCPLMNPPLEIIENGTEAILRYFEEKERLEQQNQPSLIKVREAKVLLVGQGKSGKTTLRKKLENPAAEMPAPGDTTRGIEITRLNEKNAPYWRRLALERLGLWRTRHPTLRPSVFPHGQFLVRPDHQ